MSGINPKDAVGRTKPPMSCVPANVLAELGLALHEGELKYGRHNWRVSEIMASVYYDAALRHLFSWWEGQDTDPDSGVHHVTKAIAGLVVLRDAMMHGTVDDDRPPESTPGWETRLRERMQAMVAKYAERTK